MCIQFGGRPEKKHGTNWLHDLRGGRRCFCRLRTNLLCKPNACVVGPLSVCFFEKALMNHVGVEAEFQHHLNSVILD